MNYCEISELKGLVIKDIWGMEAQSDEVIFITECGRKFQMFHSQDCCERVYLEDVTGDFNDLIGSPILLAEESSNTAQPDEQNRTYDGDLEMWTFYKLATINGYVDLRWYGSSNGYYSVNVDFMEI